MSARFWRMATRGCGRIEVVSDDRQGKLSYLELPEQLKTDAFAAARAGGLWGMIDLFNDGLGSVDTDTSSMSQGVVVHSFRFG